MKKILLNRQHNTSVNFLFIAFLAVSLLSGCATTEVAEDTEIDQQAQAIDEEAVSTGETEVAEQQQVDTEGLDKDPYEGMNRSIYGFNETVDDYVFEPIASSYQWLFPQFVQTGVANFYDNLKDISVVLNDFLQGKLKQGGKDTGRFLLNSTVGIGGLFDVATHVGLEQNDEDFAQTLAVWGVPTGPYLVIPFLGPTTVRGIPGAMVDAAANPVSYLPWGVAAGAALNKRASAQGALQFIDEAALDPYVFTRESFLQWREYLATDGNPEFSDDLDDEFFDDEEFEDSEDTEPVAVDDNSLNAETDPKLVDLDAAEGLGQSGSTATEPAGQLEAFAETTMIDDIDPQNQENVSGQSDELVVIIQGGESDAAIANGNKEQEAESMHSYDQAAKSFEAASKAYHEAAKELTELQAR
jgi:phospholipid-binding lipoprotein MlaA